MKLLPSLVAILLVVAAPNGVRAQEVVLSDSQTGGTTLNMHAAFSVNRNPGNPNDAPSGLVRSVMPPVSSQFNTFSIGVRLDPVGTLSGFTLAVFQNNYDWMLAGYRDPGAPAAWFANREEGDVFTSPIFSNPTRPLQYLGRTSSGFDDYIATFDMPPGLIFPGGQTTRLVFTPIRSGFFTPGTAFPESSLLGSPDARFWTGYPGYERWGTDVTQGLTGRAFIKVTGTPMPEPSMGAIGLLALSLLIRRKR